MRANIFILILLMSSCTREARLPDMTETFGYRETKPFGSSFFYDISASLFDGDHEVTNLSLYRMYLANEDSGAVYISLTKEINLSENDLEGLLSFTSEGNTAFIISGNIDTILLNVLGVKQRRPSMPRSFERGTVSLGQELDIGTRKFGFYHKRLTNYFISETLSLKVLGYNSDGHPDILSFKHGQGQLIILANPRSFSNYFLMTGENFQFLEKLFSIINFPVTKWYWDNYYPKLQTDERGNGSTLSEIMKYPALATAFWISLVLLVLFIAFHGKRKRSMIPVPENNSTPASFMETISELYIHEAENNEIARKLISRFQDHIGKKWFLHNISELSPESLANKTGVGLEEINDLRMLMAKAMNDEHISDEELMRLEQLIQMFYKT